MAAIEAAGLDSQPELQGLKGDPPCFFGVPRLQVEMGQMLQELLQIFMPSVRREVRARSVRLT